MLGYVGSRRKGEPLALIRLQLHEHPASAQHEMRQKSVLDSGGSTKRPCRTYRTLRTLTSRRMRTTNGPSANITVTVSSSPTFFASVKRKSNLGAFPL